MYEEDRCDRVSARRTVLLQARCRKSSWHVFPVELADISAGGCCIVGSAEAFAPGEQVQLRIAHLKPVKAEVRWLRDDRVGLEFRAPLPDEVSDELGRTYGIGLRPTAADRA